MEEVFTLAGDLIRKSPDLSGAKVKNVTALAGDAGTRRYFRLELDGIAMSSAVLMILSQAQGPYGGGTKGLSQDDTFVQVSEVFRANGIRVPAIYADGRSHPSQAALIVEDVGDLALWHVAKGEADTQLKELSQMFSGDPVTGLYKKAVDLLVKVQAIPRDPKSVIFQRTISYEKYRAEISEFSDYYLKSREVTEKEHEVINQLYDAVCEDLLAHPKIPSHVDYMSYNLCVDTSGELCVIDFQDCAAISPVRDVVSLINDRDIDCALGRERNLALLRYAKEKLNQGWDFYKLYYQYLLHWDCRVSGRFVLLSELRGMKTYGQWIEGTVRRLGRTLMCAARYYPAAHDVIEILCRVSPEFKQGVEDPWPVE